jgi:outer membrane receptor protein involved in Fe transport
VFDGPNGYDNDGDNAWIGHDGIDNDNDGAIDEKLCEDGMVDGIKDGQPDTGGRKDGQLWGCDEGIDEADEFDDPESNEYGFYYQTKTELFGTSRYALITSARLDYHDMLSESVQFAPKIGFIYKPDEKSSFRFTYGKAFNTPNSITLYTDLFVRKQGILDVYFRGNKDGTPYCRVGQICRVSIVKSWCRSTDSL